MSFVAFAAAAVALAAAAPAQPSAFPAGAYTCSRLMADTLDGATKDDFLPSVLGSFTLDGQGDYVHPGGRGRVVRDRDLLRFTGGTMKGIVASERRDAKGRAYLLIDKSIIVAPGREPGNLDAVCYKN